MYVYLYENICRKVALLKCNFKGVFINIHRFISRELGNIQSCISCDSVSIKINGNIVRQQFSRTTQVVHKICIQYDVNWNQKYKKA